MPGNAPNAADNRTLFSHIGADFAFAAAGFPPTSPRGPGLSYFALQSVGALGIWDPPHIAKTGKLLK